MPPSSNIRCSSICGKTRMSKLCLLVGHHRDIPFPGDDYWFVDRGFGIIAKFYGEDAELNASLFIPQNGKDWQSIVSSPRDGTDILLYSPDSIEPQIFVGY